MGEVGEYGSLCPSSLFWNQKDIRNKPVQVLSSHFEWILASYVDPGTIEQYAQAVSPNIYADEDLCKENERKDDDDDESSCSDDEVSSAEEEDDSDDDLM